MYDISKENDKGFMKHAIKHLQEKVLFLEKEVQQNRIEKEKDNEICKKLAEELHVLRQRFFDNKQEKNSKQKSKDRKKGKLPHNKSKNKKLNSPDIELDQEEIEYKIDENKCPKCGGKHFREMKNQFEESGEFDVVEYRYILKRHKRQKYSCKDCHNIITAPGGVKLTPGGEFSIQMATQVAIDKFEDHLPLERQRKRMKRSGLKVDTKTLYGLTEHLYNRLYPLLEMIRTDVLQEKWIHLDESPIPFYNPNKSKGYVWSLSNNRGAYYQFEPTRSGKIAAEMIRGYKGNAVSDGFSGYNFIEETDGLKHCFCWAHVRRRFYEAMANHPKAEKMVDLIDELYEIEHQAEEVEDLKDLRALNSSEIVKKIDHWINDLEGNYLGSSLLGKAINYYFERKDGLHHFLYDEFVPIDNNMAERRQRCPVMGRKNFLHFKSINGADVGVFFYSLIESCKTNGLNAKAYINEMAHLSARGEALESPYQYASRLNEQIMKNLSNELAGLSPPD